MPVTKKLFFLTPKKTMCSNPYFKKTICNPKTIQNHIVNKDKKNIVNKMKEIIETNKLKQSENIGEFLNQIKFPEFKYDEIISNERMIRTADWIWSGCLDRFKIKALNSSNIIKYSNENILKKGDIVSLRTNQLQAFLPFLNRLKEPIILISNYSDKTVDHTYKTIADNPKIYHWFAINCTLEHPKVTKIPLGLGASHNYFGNLSLLSKLIIEKHDNPNNKIFINFKIDNLRPQRTGLLMSLINQGFKNLYGMTMENYWKAIVDHEFVISPPGCGIDCYRIWETLYLGRIPIVIKNNAFNQFTDLPILFVDNYNDLFNKLVFPDEWKKKEFKWDKLRFQYWFDEINKKKKQCLGILDEITSSLPPLIDIDNCINDVFDEIIEESLLTPKILEIDSTEILKPFEI